MSILRYAAAACETDFANPLHRAAMRTNTDRMLAMIDETAPLLPRERPRYLMGVGTPDDILEAVKRGVDMFDCVMPTRNGRHGVAFTRFGQVNLRNARHADDPRPLDRRRDRRGGAPP